MPPELDDLFLCSRMNFAWVQIYGKYTNTYTDLIRVLKKHRFPMRGMIIGAVIIAFSFNESGFL